MSETKLISARAREALRILREDKPHTDAHFAELFWPGNLMHRRYSNAGTHGSRRGAGAWLASGSYLSKLEKRGLIYKRHVTTSHEYPIATLTRAGEDACAAYDAAQARKAQRHE